jgi:trans-aconitate methyltransferase
MHTTQLASELSQRIKNKKARVVDLCCGTGFSTRALHGAFPEAETVIGIDTSAEMVRSRVDSVSKPVDGKAHFLLPLLRYRLPWRNFSPTT